MIYPIFRSSLLAGIALFGLSTASAAQHAVDCPELRDADQYPDRFRSRAPFFGDTVSGWAFRNADLEYAPPISENVHNLMTQLVDEFTRRDVTLAVIVPPSRALTAGSDVIGRVAPDFSQDNASAAYHLRIDQLRNTGAYAPDILDHLERHLDDREVFYFKQDHHWTPSGAQVSALALREVLEEQRPAVLGPELGTAFVYDDWSQRDQIGSYGAAIQEVCGVELEREPAAAQSVKPITGASVDMAAALFGNAADVDSDVVLVGTSFSNHGGIDNYRSRDAFTYAMQRDVLNRAVVGGGATEPMLSYLRSQLFLNIAPELLIWEFPSTGRINDLNAFRQLIGSAALRCVDRADTAGAHPISISNNDWIEITDFNVMPFDIVNATASILFQGNVEVEFSYSGGGTGISLMESGDRTPRDLRSNFMATYLDRQQGAELEQLRVRYVGDISEPFDITLELCAG
ncbi:SGNH hydrolase-like domain-containing protein, acetyltransferase AlgX [Monaibacterium marinum]|uniref:SGNH hydrolase-like domain-containing protein, acetyltransferase AlgX n=1 Tax=Pontivivens marinum TaxID=1690039 RepID=A0A2C9CW17_9RHOB|nr:hypothetical protein [Monaibacterium marinum]SOH95462.1 SGNH hydrolase-like domain-containing protein, acetyltransferase AlgX [Monaibacterium marinum]